MPKELYKFCLEKLYELPFFNPEKPLFAFNGMYTLLFPEHAPV
uniref:Uncharacterized protein n=1 Tax=Siphoviridae sp. ct8rU2 TaxID=2825366 RepID=A0A8S5UW72_9CAUD|nr:MAG TPA: hypothetical protein [Siphoviridae sp. ct8rU2]